VYEVNKKTNKDFDPKMHPKGKNTIFEGTDILLPAVLESTRGILYPRRFAAMSDEEAEQIAKNKKIVLQDVVKPLAAQRPKWIARRAAPPPPPRGSRQEIDKAEPAAKREPTPSWFNAPQTGWQRCAKMVCEKYAALCYAECLFVAKRFTDAGSECVNLPVKLPYMLDKDGRDDCASAYP
jgi:hypothetical protein